MSGGWVGPRVARVGPGGKGRYQHVLEELGQNLEASNGGIGSRAGEQAARLPVLALCES